VEAVAERYGSKPQDLVVGIGPAICGDCYEVGEDVVRRFEKYWKENYQQFFKQKDQSLYLDMLGANEYVLRKAGVTQIEQSGICTAENLHEWYSYRKEKGLTGRFAVLLALKDEA